MYAMIFCLYTYNDIVINSKLQFDIPISNALAIPKSRKRNCYTHVLLIIRWKNHIHYIYNMLIIKLLCLC